MNKAETLDKTETDQVKPPSGNDILDPIITDDTSVLRKLFVMNYIASHKPKSDVFIADNLEKAKRLALDYCRRFNLRYLSVQPFTIDIMKDATNEDRFGHPKDGYERKE